MKVAKLMTFQAINSRKLKRSVGVDVPEGLLYDLHDFRCWIGHGLQRKGPGFSWTWRDLPDHMDMTALPDLRLSWHRAQEGPISKILQHRVLQWLGSLSMPIFLLHPIVFRSMTHFFPFMPIFLMLLSCFALVVALSWAVNRWFPA